MRHALTLAQRAYEAGEVPIGAVVLLDGVVVGTGHNRVEHVQDATAHAELLAIQEACRRLNTKYLVGARLYTTLEPCPMCAMASFWSQVSTLVFAAPDLKRGYRTISPALVHPRTQVIEGPYKTESATLLQDFFRSLR